MRSFAKNAFRPLSSGPRLRAAPSFMQDFLLRTAPKVTANTVIVRPAGAPFVETAPLIQVLQLTLPCPAPVAVMLHAQGAGGGRFEPVSAIPAERAGSGASGRIVVEWGVGETRGLHVFTDLAAGSVQLASAIYVSVSAFLEAGPAQLVTAALMPEAVFSYPRASFTTAIVTQFAGDFRVRRQPFAQALSIDFATTDDGLPFPGQLDVFGASEAATLARWILPDPVRPDEQSTPVPVSEVPLAGSIDNFVVRFSGLPNLAVVQAPAPETCAPDVGVFRPLAAANLTQTIRV